MTDAAAAGVPVSVHGPAGVLDLVVPPGASSADVGGEYARQAGTPVDGVLWTSRGRRLDPDEQLDAAGVREGAVLVATGPGSTPPARRRAGDPDSPAGGEGAARTAARAGAGSAALLCLAVAAAWLAGWLTTRDGAGDGASLAIQGVLALGVVLGALPLGPLAAQRAAAVPGVAAALTLSLAWSPEPELLPTTLGTAALGGALAAAVVRALGEVAEGTLRVWMVAGVAGFVLTTGAALLDAPDRVVWSVALAAAVLAARLVPLVAIDVPDHYLVDVERLAVTAWSARERPRGRRGRVVVPPDAVRAVAERGARLLAASSGAVLVAAVLAAPLLLRATPVAVDHLGARVLLGCAGGALLLAARSHRYVVPRALLRAAGLWCWVALLVDLAPGIGDGLLLLVTVVAVAGAVLLVVVAVAVGRGWRSAWWSRRAEVAEALLGACALAAVVVSSGLFRALWET
ncbi:MAG: hypothetical protein CMH83_10900 [Nocardioides sp.]|nr:hypothetical protein [Nocardioides sp.]